MQILMAVMMATFMAMMVPRAAVCAERIGEVLDTESSVGAAGRAGARLSSRTAGRAARRRVRLPGRREPVLRDVDAHGRARPDHGDHRQHRRRQDHPGQPDAAAVRRHGRRGAGRRRRRPRARPGPAVGRDRPGAAEAVPLLRARSPPTCGTASPTPPRRSSGRRCGSRRRGLRRGDAEGGWTRRSRRAAPTSPAASASARDRPGAGPARRSTSSTTRSPPWTRHGRPRCARPSHRTPPRRPSSSSPSGSPPSWTRTGSSCWTRAAVVGTGTHTKLMDTATPTGRSCTPS